LRNDQVFTCHKQLKLQPAARRPCVGSAMVLQKEKLLFANLAYRLHILFNNFPDNYNWTIPVFESLEEFANRDR
jgi:hypothetical protein